MDRSLATLYDFKEKANARTTAKEVITKLQAVENIKTRIQDNLKPMEYTTFDVAHIDTIVYLAGEKEEACSNIKHYFCTGNLSLLFIYP